VWYLRGSLNISNVIPAKLAVASASRNPGISKDSGYRFRDYDGGEAADLFWEL